MDNGYATCPRCKWAGRLRKDGTMRKHRESVDMGHFTMSGGLPQQTNGDVCKGSGEKPWDYTPPEGGYTVKTTEHGSARLVSHEGAKQDNMTDRYVVHKLGPHYFGVWDTVMELYVSSCSNKDVADRDALRLNGHRPPRSTSDADR